MTKLRQGWAPVSEMKAAGKLDSSLRAEDDVGLCSNFSGDTDIESVYSFFCANVGKNEL